MRKPLAVLVVMAALAAIAACGSDEPTSTPPTSAAANYPVTVGSLTLDKRPEHIVSLSPTATEMLFAIGAGKQVTAVDDNSTYPTDAPKSDLSAYKPNAEAVAAKQPDLVIISNDIDKIVANLGTLKIPVYLAPAATTLDDTYRQLAEIGTLTGHKAEADQVVQGMKTDIDALLKDLPPRSKPLTYFYELDPTLYTVTSHTFIGSLLGPAGLANIADAAGKDNPYPQLSAEVVVKAAPDIIFLSDTKAFGSQTVATVKARAGWGDVPAVKNGQVVELDPDIASRWGPRVVDLLRDVTKAVAEVPVG